MLQSAALIPGGDRVSLHALKTNLDLLTHLDIER
jgi:hypothetical protein